MESNNQKKSISYTGLGLIFGCALGSFLGLVVLPGYFALLAGGGIGLGLIIGAIIDVQVRGK